MLKQDDNFCGYSCGDEKQNLQEIIDRTVAFSKINPEWGLIMLGKFMEMVYDARLKLSQDMTKWPAPQIGTIYAECQRCAAPGEIHYNHVGEACKTCGKDCYGKDPCYEMESESGPK